MASRIKMRVVRVTHTARTMTTRHKYTCELACGHFRTWYPEKHPNSDIPMALKCHVCAEKAERVLAAKKVGSCG